MTDFEIVERPAPKAENLAAALRATAVTGKALHLRKPAAYVSHAYWTPMHARGLRVRAWTDHNGGCYAWCEKIEKEETT